MTCLTRSMNYSPLTRCLKPLYMKNMPHGSSRGANVSPPPVETYANSQAIPPIPNLSDPFLWYNYCTYRFEGTGRTDAIRYYDGWRISEGIGDKTLSKIVLEKLEAIGLPFGVITSVHDWLTSNEMFERWAIALPCFEDVTIQQRLDDAYEVTFTPFPLLPDSEDNQVWNRIVENDPLYLFTDLPYLRIVSELLSVNWEPFYGYLGALYGPVLRFDNGSPIVKFQSQGELHGIPVKRGRLTAKNFRYQHCGIVKVQTLPFWKSLKTHTKSSIYRSHLYVRVPANAQHDFWMSNLYSWNDNKEAFEFSVTKFGGSQEEADWWATTYAMEIIRCARADGVPTQPLSRPPKSDCEALRLCRRLHKLWESGSKSFEDPPANKDFWSQASATLDSMMEEYIKFKLLLQYYKVKFLCFNRSFVERRCFLCCGWDRSMRHSHYLTKSRPG